MRAFLRDNVAILIGVSLPLLVVAFFVIASNLPKAYVDPPQHDLLLLGQDGAYQSRPVQLDITVVEGRLRVRTFKPDYRGNVGVTYFQAGTRLYIWSHETRSFREVPIDLPADVETFDNGTEIAVPPLVGKRLVTELRAPDGYEYRTTGYGGGGAFDFLFSERSRPRTSIVKDGAAVTLTPPGNLPYWGVQFLAWVVE